MKKAWWIILIVLIAGGLIWWLVSADDSDQTNTNSAYSTSNVNSSSTTNVTNTASNQTDKLAPKPTATVETSKGTFTIQFYPSEAPELVKNFIELAKTGYYDGLIFHRVIPGFVIQGGDPLGTGTGGHSYKGEGQGLADEPGALALKHLRGAVAWAKSSLPNSIGSQFYVALQPVTQLDGGYSVFGQVTDGLDVIDDIAAVPTDANDKPTTPVTITKVTITE